jgi:5-deoxy-D-glucuronate isomerase
MQAPIRPALPTIQEEKKVKNGSQITRLTIHPSSTKWQYDVISMKQIGKGPVEYLKVVTGPGLSYSSTEWGDPEARVKPPRVLPSVFVKYELPKNHSNLEVSLEEGPDWCYNGFSVETLENGKPYLLSNVAAIKFLLSTGKYEIAKKVVLKLTWR